MKCGELMKDDVRCLSENDSAKDAAVKMEDANVGFLPVCDESHRVLGTVTDRDIALRVVAKDLPAGTTKVSEIMTREVVSCRSGDDVKVAEKLMGQKKKSRILVTDDGGVHVGVISLSDVAAHDGKNAGRTLQEVTSRESRAA
jgi:CBS domain-containing protein